MGLDLLHLLMDQTEKPKARLLVSTHCLHCHALERLLRERMQRGSLESLEVINIEQSPEVAQLYAVRSVPWLQLDTYIFDEALTPSELDSWIETIKEQRGKSHYISYLLAHAKLDRAIEWVENGKATLKDVISILENPDEKINVRVGVGAILEHFENTEAMRAIVPDLISMLDSRNPMIRIDVCHYLSLTHSREVIDPLKRMLKDEDDQVRQVAQESIDVLLNGREN